MGANSNIEWCHHTFNTHWGCTRVSPGCGGAKGVGGCYAETFAHRLGLDIWGPDAPRRFFGDKHWAEPEKWNASAVKRGVRERVFVNSMSDTFEDRRDLDPVRERLFALIERCTSLDFLLLTKRPQNIARLAARWRGGWPSNAWAGTTCEDQQRADERIPHLLATPAAVRFLSCEPLLGPVDLALDMIEAVPGGGFLHNRKRSHPCEYACGGIEIEGGIHWVIAGGESGHNPRPMHPAWAQSLRDQCVHAGVAFFFKQWGESAPLHQLPPKMIDDPNWPSASLIGHLRIVDTFEGPAKRDPCPTYRVGKKRAGRLLDGREWNEFPGVRTMNDVYISIACPKCGQRMRRGRVCSRCLFHDIPEGKRRSRRQARQPIAAKTPSRFSVSFSPEQVTDVEEVYAGVAEDGGLDESVREMAFSIVHECLAARGVAPRLHTLHDDVRVSRIARLPVARTRRRS